MPSARPRKDEAPEHGRLLLLHALTAMFAEGDLEKATSRFEDAYALAERVGDRDGQMLALSGRGRVLIKAGDVPKAVAALREAGHQVDAEGAVP